MKLEAAKSKVAQLKQLTIPHLELQAAVLASCQAKTIYESRIELNGSFKPFVSSRVGEIQSNSSPRQWQHIPGQLHVEDDITREIHVVGATTPRQEESSVFWKEISWASQSTSSVASVVKWHTKLKLNSWQIYFHLDWRLIHHPLTSLHVIISHHNFNVKITRNKTAKHYGVFLTCTNIGAVNLEMAFFALLSLHTGNSEKIESNLIITLYTLF